jgi:hypothetical protein
MVFIIEVKLWEKPRSVNEDCWRHSCWLRLKGQKGNIRD